MKARRTAAAVISVILCAAQMGVLPASSAEAVFGDINSDGKVNSRDAGYVRNEIEKLASKKPDGITSSVWCNGDVDRNAVLDEKDAEWLEKYEEYTEGGGTAGLREFITGEPDKEGYSDYGTFNEGKNTWAVTDDGTLVIGGEGGMPDVASNWDRCPWALYSQTRKLKKIVVEEGVEHIGEYIFKYIGTVPEVEFPSTLTSVGKWAFINCFALSDVSLPEGVVKIGEKAFASCDSLERVSVPSTVTDLGTGAFSGNKNLREADLAEGLLSLGTECFKGDTALTEITLPESLETVDPKAFSNTGLTTVVIPDKVAQIQNYTFSDCESLETVSAGKGLKLIGSGAFKNCKELKSVVLQDGIDTIGSGAFENCTSLKSVKIPGSVTTVGEDAFRGCTSMTDITIPENVKSFGFSHLDTCTSLKTIVIENPDCNVTLYYDTPLYDVTVYCYPGSSAEDAAKKCGAKVVLMEGKSAVTAQGECGEGLEWTLNNRGILRITGSGTMTDFTEENMPGWSEYPDLVSSVIIEAEITGIGANSFSGLTELGTVSIPETVKSIGDGAFSGCRNISDIDLPAGLETIGKGAFSGCTSLYYLDFPEGLKTIGEDAFRGSSVIRAELPDSMERIGSGAFADCERFIRLQTDSADCIIDDGALADGNRAVMVIAPVGSEAQKYADENRLLFISSDDTSELACSGTAGEDIVWTLSRKGMLVITGSGDISDWGRREGEKELMGSLSPWNYCREMEMRRIPPVTGVDISGGITGIGSNSFYGCEITTAEIPDSVERIGRRAFSSCPLLESITLPKSVKSIEEAAFGDCRALKEITILRPDCEIYDSPETISNGIDQEKMTGVSATENIYSDYYSFSGMIKGPADSTSEKYAEKYGYNFMRTGETQEKPMIAGDANDDGKVNVADAVAVLQFVANQTKYPLSERGVKNADCDGTAGITGSDALVIQQIDAGIYKP